MQRIAWELRVGSVLTGSALFRCASTCMLGDRKDGDLCPGQVAFFCLLLLGLILELFLFFLNLGISWFFSSWVSLYPFLLVQISCHHHCHSLRSVCRFTYLPEITLA